MLRDGAQQVGGDIELQQVDKSGEYYPLGSVLVLLVCELPRGVDIDTSDLRMLIHKRHTVAKTGTGGLRSDVRALAQEGKQSSDRHKRKEHRRNKIR